MTTTNTTKNPKCLVCGRRKTVHRVGNEGSTYKCTGCGAMFDPDPDEGGTYYTDPTKRLEREDEDRVRRQQPRVHHSQRSSNSQPHRHTTTQRRRAR